MADDWIWVGIIIYKNRTRQRRSAVAGLAVGWVGEFGLDNQWASLQVASCKLQVCTHSTCVHSSYQSYIFEIIETQCHKAGFIIKFSSLLSFCFLVFLSFCPSIFLSFGIFSFSLFVSDQW